MTEYTAENARAACLVRRIGSGDRRAEADLVHLFDSRLAVKLQRHTTDPDALSELRQEIWMRVILAVRRGEIGEPDHAYGFILGTARNVVREHFKAVRRARHESPDALAMIPDPAISVERLLDDAQLAECLHACLAEMTARDREILVRHYFRGDPKEITCELLGLTPLNYNNVLHRARRRLADLLEQEPGDESAGARLQGHKWGYRAS